MISPFHSGISAISAFSAKMNATANNVANVNSDGFKKSRTTLEEGRFGGVEPDVDEVDTPGYTKRIVDGGQIRDVEGSNVDLAEEFTDSTSDAIRIQSQSQDHADHTMKCLAACWISLDRRE
jgi:flagellar basal body rod protein FlgG